jgi:hypothetical protein
MDQSPYQPQMWQSPTQKTERTYSSEIWGIAKDLDSKFYQRAAGTWPAVQSFNP